MAEAAVSYAPRPDATPEAEISALASVYRLVLEASRKKKKAVPDRRPDAAKGSKHDSRHLKYTG